MDTDRRGPAVLVRWPPPAGNDTKILAGLADLVNAMKLGFIRLPPLEYTVHDFLKWARTQTGGRTT